MIQSKNSQSGQSLIETLVAIFILVTALSVGLGLAIYASSNTTRTKNQIIATNLAREGLEVVRMFRDTNWLKAEDDAGVDDLYTAFGGCMYGLLPSTWRPCYPEAFDEPYDIEASSSANDYRIFFNPSAETDWEIDTSNGTENYLLCLHTDGTYRHNNPGGSGITCDSSQFARRVSISVGNTSAPFTPSESNPAALGFPPNYGGHSPELVVTSTVVWQGKRCPAFTSSVNPLTFTTPCKLTMSERLTNWKDYE